MAVRKDSGAAAKSGKERKRSSRSKGRPWMVEVVRGDGRAGRAGFVSESYALINEIGSGSGEAFLPAN